MRWNLTVWAYLLTLRKKDTPAATMEDQIPEEVKKPDARDHGTSAGNFLEKGKTVSDRNFCYDRGKSCR